MTNRILFYQNPFKQEKSVRPFQLDELTPHIFSFPSNSSIEKLKNYNILQANTISTCYAFEFSRTFYANFFFFFFVRLCFHRLPIKLQITQQQKFTIISSKLQTRSRTETKNTHFLPTKCFSLLINPMRKMCVCVF